MKICILTFIALSILYGTVLTLQWLAKFFTSP
jgi:hypothetical protein